MMSVTEQELWDKILDFEIDDPESSFMFSDRLSRENDWSTEFALRAILEYKRFMFLVCISNQPQTPSDQVDQVWHLHLLYTQSYWIDFCKHILGKDIHHGPTKGSEEKGHFKNLYQDTLNLYQLKFDEAPPKDIWPPESIRFGQINFTRVNRHTHWVIPKLKRK